MSVRYRWPDRHRGKSVWGRPDRPVIGAGAITASLNESDARPDGNGYRYQSLSC